ncbi:MAG: hypothetical protein QNJ74_16155 [Trichodesmium sp. MO_231.B1]|nr:hypothetical protein [Trichodesmium sp. MO_231.B1]
MQGHDTTESLDRINYTLESINDRLKQDETMPDKAFEIFKTLTTFLWEVYPYCTEEDMNKMMKQAVNFSVLTSAIFDEYKPLIQESIRDVIQKAEQETDSD